MAKLGKKAKLTLGLAALLALSACESKEKKAEREAAAERERVAAVEKAEREAKEREYKLTSAIYDSLMNVPNTIDGMSAKQAGIYCDDFRNNCGIGTKHELDSLRNVSMAQILDKRVISSGKTIVEKHLKALFASLATYDLGINTNAKIQQMLAGTVVGSNYYYDLNFYGEEASDTVYGRYLYDFEDNQRAFVSAVLNGADTAQYGASRKAEIVKIIEKRYVQMMSELKANRIAVAKEFADYYPVLDINRIPKQYRQYMDFDPALEFGGEGDSWYSYDKNSWRLKGDFAIVKSVNVYDSKLKPEFFNVPGAKYKLVQVAKGKWQVVRTLKGKVEKTPVFTHNVDYKTEMQSWGITQDVKAGDNSFSASAGTNLGVHISVTEYEYVARAVKSDKLPDPKGERAARIAQLEQKQVEIDSLQSQYWDYSERAHQRASEIAVKRLGRNR